MTRKKIKKKQQNIRRLGFYINAQFGYSKKLMADLANSKKELEKTNKKVA